MWLYPLSAGIQQNRLSPAPAVARASPAPSASPGPPVEDLTKGDKSPGAGKPRLRIIIPNQGEVHRSTTFLLPYHVCEQTRLWQDCINVKTHRWSDLPCILIYAKYQNLKSFKIRHIKHKYKDNIPAHVLVLSCQPRVTVTSCFFVYKVIRDL